MQRSMPEEGTGQRGELGAGKELGAACEHRREGGREGGRERERTGLGFDSFIYSYQQSG